MTTVAIPTRLRRALRTRTWFRNGFFPASQSRRALIDDVNHLLYIRTKLVGSWRCPIASVPNGSSSADRWRGMFHSSSHASQLVVILQCMMTGNDTTPFDPYAKLLVELANGDDVGTVELHTGDDGTGSNSTAHPPSEWVTGIMTLKSGGLPVTLTANTDYFLTFSDVSSRLISAAVYERALPADTDNNYLPDDIVTNGPILDEHREQLVQLLRTDWKRNRRQLLNWASNTDASAPTRVSATPANLLDQTLTSNTAASPGVTFYLANMSTVRRTTVPVRMFVFAKASGTGTGHVHLEASDGTDYLDVEIDSSTAAWYEVTGSLPSTDAKYDIFAYGNGADTLTVYAVCVACYEA